MEITVNIRTYEYYVKKAKIYGSSSNVYVPKSLIGKEVLCLPLLSPDLLIVNENDDGSYLINCCPYEMVRKIVKPKKAKDNIKSGNILFSIDNLGDDILIIPSD